MQDSVAKTPPPEQNVSENDNTQHPTTMYQNHTTPLRKKIQTLDNTQTPVPVNTSMPLITQRRLPPL